MICFTLVDEQRNDSQPAFVSFQRLSLFQAINCSSLG